jgi:hypothetical protein
MLVTPFGIEPMTFWLAAQCLYQMYHHTFQFQKWWFTVTNTIPNFGI